MPLPMHRTMKSSSTMSHEHSTVFRNAAGRASQNMRVALKGPSEELGSDGLVRREKHACMRSNHQRPFSPF
eukprot:5073561-Pleurochrysis_carterae.AAC.2